MSHLRLLFWLRWKYLWRSTWAKRATMLIGWLSAFIVATVAASMIYLLLNMAREKNVAPEIMSEYLALGFAVLYLGWLYFSSLSELFDPQKLAVFPIAPRTIFVGTCLSSVLGQMPIYALAIWIGIAWGWPAESGPMAIRAVLFLVMVAHLVMFSRLMRLTFLQFLTSRRWRDIAMVLGALLGGGFYLGIQLLRSESDRMQDAAAWVGHLAETRAISTWLCWMPSTWFAWAFEADGRMAWSAAVAAVVSTGAVAWLGGKVEETLAFSEPVFAYTPKKKVAGEPVRFLRGLTGRVGQWFGREIAAVARKEALLLARDPTVRSRLILGSFYVVLLFFWPAISKGRGPQMAGGMSGFIVLFSEMQILLNIFGTDGSALKAMAVMPVDRRLVVLGKNLCHALAFLPLNMVLITAFALLHSREQLSVLPLDLAVHVAAFGVLVGMGSLFSVYLPAPMVAPGQRMQRTDSGDGCAMALARTAALMGVTALMAPIGGARFLVTALDLGWMGAVAAGAAAIIYGGVLYGVGAWLAGKALIAREEKLIGHFARA